MSIDFKKTLFFIAMLFAVFSIILFIKNSVFILLYVGIIFCIFILWLAVSLILPGFARLFEWAFPEKQGPTAVKIINFIDGYLNLYRIIDL